MNIGMMNGIAIRAYYYEKRLINKLLRVTIRYIRPVYICTHKRAFLFQRVYMLVRIYE